MPADQQAKFDALYERDGEVRARALARFGVDGMPALQLARSIAAQSRNGGYGIPAAEIKHEPTLGRNSRRRLQPCDGGALRHASAEAAGR